MSKRRKIKVPLNRVEGDLEIRVELEGGKVVEAWSSGTLYRGFENLLIGRAALDGLVITPRICGICGTAHLTAAARALDKLAGVVIPPNATLIRNLALMTEHLQSDMRHGFLMFATDFINPAYIDSANYDEAVRRYKSFEGETVVETIRQTKKILEIVAILGGQWPHSTYMIPGGVVSTPSRNDLDTCRYLLKDFRDWYERRVLGCRIERILELGTAGDLDAWLNESAAHAASDLGFYIRFCREQGLDKLSGGPGNYISFGSLDLPENTTLKPGHGKAQLVPAGFVGPDGPEEFDQALITEDVSHAWYQDNVRALHPFEGRTVPFASGDEGRKYSWSKAPRYKELPAETGPLAEFVVGAHPLFISLIEDSGPSVFARELARLVRPASLIPAMETWLGEIDTEAPFLKRVGEMPDGEACGLTQATRGALGHWIKIKGGRIEHYQIITPTAWHASPRDCEGRLGAWEQALAGVDIADPSNPVELGHVVRSFDACLVCTVHTTHGSNEPSSFPIGTI